MWECVSCGGLILMALSVFVVSSFDGLGWVDNEFLL